MSWLLTCVENCRIVYVAATPCSWGTPPWDVPSSSNLLVSRILRYGSLSKSDSEFGTPWIEKLTRLAEPPRPEAHLNGELREESKGRRPFGLRCFAGASLRVVTWLLTWPSRWWRHRQDFRILSSKLANEEDKKVCNSVWYTECRNSSTKIIYLHWSASCSASSKGTRCYQNCWCWWVEKLEFLRLRLPFQG